jgi:hypothetical protein
MRHLVLLLALSAVTAAPPARADAPYECAPGLLRKVTLVAAFDGFLDLRATFRAPAGFEPATSGLRIDLSFEPEADSANGVFVASIPALQVNGRALVYDDPGGSIAGIMSVRMTGRGRAKKIAIHGKVDANTPGYRDGTLRLTLIAGTGCVRTCGVPCIAAGDRAAFSCRRARDRNLCGVRSGCELLNVAGGHCLLPYPSAAFERDDPTTPTGKRITFPRGGMPANTSGVHIDPTAWNVLDGFSPGPIAIVHFPQGVDLAASHVAPLTDFAASLAADSPTILLDADTGERIAHFGELDVTATTKRAFMIRPGRRLENGHHYIVALRHLVDASGKPIKPETAFRALRSNRKTGNAALEARRATFATVFAKLEDAGVRRRDLILAWDFHTASDQALEGWLLSMRDQTFAQLGTAAPRFTVTQTEDDPFGDPRVCRRVRGTYDVPLFMTEDAPGGVVALDASGMPVQTGVVHAPFTAIIPCSLVSPAPRAGRPIFYGHGLLGTGDGEVGAENLRALADTYGFVLAATDWQGMAAADLATIAGFIGDLSGFRKLPERLHQGVLNQLVLGQLLKAPDGLSADAAFKYGGVSVIDATNVYFYGISQGGILGGTVMALTQHATRGVLGVPAANFSTLLQRSVPFNAYAQAVGAAYPDELDRILGFPLTQQLWDRTDPNGWYHHTVSDPLPGTPAHKVLVHMATGDSEVSNLATQIMVRSLGIPQLKPVVSTYFGISEADGPFDGSAMVESDGHYGAPPITNTPPAANGAHGAMREVPAIQQQVDRFLRPDGVVQSFCDGACDPG